MKRFRFLLLPFLAAMSVFLTRCGDADETPSDAESGDTTVAATPAPEAVAPAAPVNMLIVRHKVKDYAKFKASFDANDSLRQANGIHPYVIGRGVEDPNMVLVATRVDDVEKAKAFSKSEDLKKAMEKAGVIGKPIIRVTTVPFLVTTPSSDPRSMTFLTVKDYDTWKSSFDTSKQSRMDNGLVDRAVGYDVDDKHKVIYVGSVLDSAKVRAYQKSDALKARLKASGVEGNVERFWYRVVQTY